MPTRHFITAVKHSQAQRLGLPWAAGQDLVLELDLVLVLELLQGAAVVLGPVEGLVVVVAVMAVMTVVAVVVVIDLPGHGLVECPQILVLVICVNLNLGFLMPL